MPIEILEAKFQSLTSTRMGSSGSSTFICSVSLKVVRVRVRVRVRVKVACSVSLKVGLSEPLATLVFTLDR